MATHACMPLLPESELLIREVDPCGDEALGLLRLAAAEMRLLYPELQQPGAPEPGNSPTPPRGVYLVASRDGHALAMGAHRPLDAQRTELRRLYVHPDVRRQGLARRLLMALEAYARDAGFTQMLLETGYRQLSAQRLYEACGYRRIAAFGAYADDPTSVCFAKPLQLCIARCTAADIAAWLPLRLALWPEGEAAGHRAEMLQQLAEPARQAQWLGWAGETAVGLAEASLRHEYVNGTEGAPVLFLEGLYVAPGWRRQGLARRLVDTVAAWGVAQGCREFASDTPLDNLVSQRLHLALGFAETERVVYFRRLLG